MFLGGGGKHGGEAEPDQEQYKFLTDEFDAASVPLFDHGNGFHFAIDGFDAPSFAVESAEVACGQRLVEYGGNDDHGFAALMLMWSATPEGA